MKNVREDGRNNTVTNERRAPLPQGASSCEPQMIAGGGSRFSEHRGSWQLRIGGFFPAAVRERRKYQSRRPTRSLTAVTLILF